MVGTSPNGTTWSPAQALLPNPGEALTGDGYGESVGISGERAIVGAFNADKGRGAAYVFARDAGTWSEQAKLRASDAPAGTASAESSFGYSVGISGLTDVVGAPAKQVGTDRFLGGAYVFPALDTDGDGLPDDWETNGVTIDGVFVDLPAMGANPLHKDIFVHADWMWPDPARPGVVFKPERRAIKIGIDAFAIAPLENPDHRPGVNLHVDLGPTSVLSYVTGATTTWGALSRAGEVPFQATLGSFNPNKTYNWSAVDAVKALHFLPAKRSAVFHYALFANNFSPEQNGGISRGLNAADFIVTLGDWYEPGGTLLEQAGTFMHELGHNLGLHHGGADDVNNKPNYLSIMNYSFQDVGVFQSNGLQRSFDYSRSLLSPLDERSLDEFVGINDPAMHLTFWSRRTRPDVPEGSNQCFPHPSSYFKLFFPTDGLDWNCDGLETAIPVAADINADGVCTSFGNNLVTDSTPGGDDVEIFGKIMSGPNRICETTAAGDDQQEHAPGFAQPDILTGFNDWPAVVFDGGGSIGGSGVSASAPLSTANDEPTLEQILDVVPVGVHEEESIAPLDVVSLSTQAGPAPLLVDFDGSASTAVNGTIVDWAWDFGDGATGSGATVPHTYNLPGEYFASVTVTDSNGHVNLVPLLQHVEVFDGTIATPTPPTTPTLISTPTPTVTPPPSTTPTRTATPLPGSTPTRTPTPAPTLGLVVTTAADNGDDANPIPGSLRQTILTANAKANPVGGVDVVTFNIPGAGVHTIAPLNIPLPWITDPVTIDGYTQPGASPNTRTVGDDAALLIELAPDVPGGYGFVLRGTGGSTVRGIVINRYRNVGILVDSDDNVVEGCFIGTNAAGDTRLIPVFTNSDEAGLVDGGIFVISGANNRIGGTLPAARNVIVGNGEFGGIRLGNDVYRGVADTRIQGNYIGTNAAGSAALNEGGINNGGPGVQINGLKATNTLIGGTQPGAGNLISGNKTEGSGFGIWIIYASGDVTIQGNLIGTNAQGTAAIGNASGGIFAGGVFGGPVGRLVIGGPQPGARNVISGNGVDGLNGQQVVSAGIALSVVAPDGVVVQGNFIGTGSDGVTLIPNFVHGIGITVISPTSYTIGGMNPGEGNVIAGNARHGIDVRGDPTGPVTILGNSFFSNGGLSAISGGLGINLTGSSPEDGFRVTGNDPCDADVGPNGGQNYPELTTADSAGGATTIAGTLDSTPGTQFRIEFFSSPVCDESGHGEGHTFIGATTVTTAAGPCSVFALANLDIGAMVQPAVAVGQFITATATDPNGNTSEFSNCVQVTGAGPIPTFTSTSASTPPPTGPTATPSLTAPGPTRTAAPENCYDCIDNDGDGKIDRDDEDCPARANGMQLGLAIPGKGAKAIAKCAKTIGKAGAKFSAGRLKHLQKCVNGAFVCVQQKPNDATCAAKTQKTCAKELAKSASDEGKLRRAVLKTCAPPAVDTANLRSVAGIGYETEIAVCLERGVGTLTSANDVVDCLVAQHECRVEDLVASEVPRAVELFRLAGRDPRVELPCLVAAADGAGADLGAAKGKLAVKCQKAIGKAGARFASVKAKLTQKCLSAVYVCVQVKPTDAKCRPKAETTCRKQLAKLTAPGKGATAKLAAAITKSCTKAPLGLADLLENGGLGFAALDGECAALGVPSLGSLADVSTCLERRHTCRVQQMIETEMPRVEELLEATP